MAGNLSSLKLGPGIKSIQRGVSAAGAATITAVNTAKTELRNLGGSASSGSCSVVLTNPTTVTISATAGDVSWELTEWY